MSHIKNLDLKRFIVSTPLFKMSCLGDHRLYAAMTKFFQIEDRFNISNYYLRKVIKINHNAVITSSKTGEVQHTQEAQNIVRFINAENAILGFNACYDYILQIVYFALYICPDFSTREEFLHLSKECDFSKNKPLRQKFRLLYQKDKNATKFYDKLTTFYCDSRKRIQDYANIIKHQGGFYIIDFPQPTSPCVYCGKDGNIIFNPKMFDPEYVSIDELIAVLSEVSKTIYTFTNYLFKFLSFPWDVKIFSCEKYKPVILFDNAEQTK